MSSACLFQRVNVLLTRRQLTPLSRRQKKETVYFCSLCFTLPYHVSFYIPYKFQSKSHETAPLYKMFAVLEKKSAGGNFVHEILHFSNNLE